MFPFKTHYITGVPQANKYLQVPVRKHMSEGGCIGAQGNWRAHALSKGGGATTHSRCLLTFRNTDPVLVLLPMFQENQEFAFHVKFPVFTW